MPDDLSDGYSTPPVALRRQQQQQRQRDGIMSPRLLMSPKSQNPANLLGSNDDEQEKALSRAARASISRRKSIMASGAKPQHVASRPGSNGVRPNMFGKDQLVDLFNNCIKLASENKINQKNTWDLNLIDHLSELVRIDSDDEDAETNFQKASCTLETGVKIYSLRVDSTHSEAYKVLGGINRVSRDDDKEIVEESDKIGHEKEDEAPKKEIHKKLSPLSTLESSFEALNVKKFDVAFTVDPLYHQTTAQFDEGGAKGLLLCNLGVYGSCKVLFDSFEVPGNNMVCETSSDRSEQIDLSFAREEIEQMTTQMPMKNDISPTLREIVDQFDEDNQRPPDTFPAATTTIEKDYVVDNDDVEWEGNETANWDFDPEDQTSMVENDSFIDSSTNNHQEENAGKISEVSHTNERLITGFLSLGLGFDSKQNAWAGPEYWKYWRTKVHEQVTESTVESSKVKKPKNRNQKASDIEFTKLLESPQENIFVLPQNPKILLLPTKSVTRNITLPEDHQYQPENLVRLFLLPGASCFGKGTKTVPASEEYSSCDPISAWGTEDAVDDQFDDQDGFDGVDDLGDLVSQPRQVNKIEVKYDKFSQQVDVHALKEVLWYQIQESNDKSQTDGDAAVSFRHILESMADSSQASADGEISTHLYFICLLHLANEHGLKIYSSPTLDELEIHVPSAVKSGN